MATIAIELAVAYVSIVPEVSGISKGVKAALKDTDREFESAGKKSGGLFSKMVGANLASGAITAAASKASAGIGMAFTKGLDRLVSLDQARASLKGLGHDAASVETIMKSANAAVKGTAFGMGEASQAAANAVAAGVKPGQELERTLKLVGDAATIGGTGMGEMGAIFNKVAASNKIQMGEMNQLMDRGIPIQQMLADHLGVSVEQVQKLSSEGKIGFADFQAAMEKGLGGAALASGGTFTGALKNVQSAMGRIGAAFLGPAFAQMAPFFQKLIPLIDRLSPLATRAGAAFGTALAPALDLILRGVDFLTGVLERNQDTIFNWAAMAGETVASIGRGFAGLWAILARGDFAGVDMTFGLEEDSPVVGILFRLREGFLGLVDTVRSLDFSAVSDAFGRLGPAISGAMGSLSDVEVDGSGLQTILDKVAAGMGWVADNADKIAAALPYVIGGLVLLKGATEGVSAANNAFGFNSGWRTAAMFAQASATWAQVLATRANTAATTQDTAATNIGTIAKLRAAAGAAAHRVATIAATVATRAMTAGQWLLNAALSANPLGLIVLGIMALVGAIVLAWKNSETFRNVVMAVWEAIKWAAAAVVDWFVNVVAPFFVGLWETLSSGAGSAASGMTSAWQGVKDFFTGLWEGVKAIFSSALDFLAGLFFKFHPVGIIIAHWEPIVAFFSGLWARVSGAFTAGLDAIWAVVGPWVQWFMGVFKAAWGVLEFLIALPIRLAQLAVMAAWDLIRAAFQSAWDWVSGTFMGWWRTIAPLIDGVMATVRAGIDTAWKWIADRFAQAWAWISGPFMAGYRLLSGLIDAVMTAVRNGINVAWQWIQDRFQQAWAWVSGVFMGWWRQLTGLIDGVFTLVRNAIGAGWQWIQDRFSQAWAWVSGTFMGWWRSLTGLMETPIRLAREAIDGVLDGIKSGFERAVDFVRDTWDRIKEIVSAPVRVAIKVGNALISGFRTVAKAVGLDDIAGKLVDIPPLPAFAGGGRANIVPGSRSRGVDSTLAVTGRGVPIARVDPGEGIVRYGAMRSLDRFHPGAFDYINKHGMLPGFFQGGTLPTPGPVRPHPLPYHGARYAADMGLGTGSPVYAWRDGTVSQIMYANTSYGNRIRANHGDAGQTLYAHLSRILVSVGQAVKAGQKIGEVGYSGNVKPPGPGGAHLHFEILGGNAPISASGSAQGESSGFFDWVGDLAGKFAGPLRELAGIGSSPVAEIVKAIPKMVADGMLGKLKSLIPNFGDDSSLSGSSAGSGWQGNANLLMQAGKALGASRQAMKIALMTAAQESSLGTNKTAMYKINGDGDVGWFQQRATRGDGTVAQLADPLYALRVFLLGKTVPAGYHVPGLYNKNWQSMGLGQAAQAVQVSAFPHAYDKWADEAEAWLNSYKYDSGGWLQPGVTMTRNETRKPEAVLTQPQWRSFEKVAEALADGRLTPSELVVVDADGALVGRMRVEAQSALADSYARVGGR